MPEKPSKLMPALYGGIIMGVISGVPFLSIINCFCCAGVLLGGFLAVFFYNKELTSAMPPLASGDCVAIGALAGVFGALIGTIIHIIMLAAVGNMGSEILLEILRGMRDQIPPEVLDQIEQSLSQAGDLTGISIAISFFTSIIIDPLFGLLGGLIGYSVYKQKPGAMPPAASMHS